MADKTRTYAIPEDQVPELIEAFGDGYQTVVPDPAYVDSSDPDDPASSSSPAPLVDNPQSLEDYALARLDDFLVGQVRSRIKRHRRSAAAYSSDDAADFVILRAT